MTDCRDWITDWKVKPILNSRMLTAVLAFGLTSFTTATVLCLKGSDSDGEFAQNPKFGIFLNTCEAGHIRFYSEWVVIWA